jgi:hypothetical protein
MPSASLLTQSYDNVDRTSYTTASVSPTANRWLVVDCWGRDDATLIPVPTVSGLSLSWVTELTDQSASTTHRIGRFYAATGGSPGSGTITIDWGASTVDGAAWIVYELSSDVDASDPFVQSVSNELGGTNTSITVTLAAYGSSDNRPLICAVHRANEASSPEAGYTEIGDVNGASPITGFAAAYNSTTTDTTPSYSWVTGASDPQMAIASEIKAAGAGGGAVVRRALLGVGV